MSKIQNTVSELELSDTIEELSRRRERGDSLRDLRDYYNKEVIRSTIARGDGSSLVDAEIILQTLEGDAYSNTRVEVEAELHKMGINVEQLESRLVSHETIRKYLNQQDIVPESDEAQLTVEDAKGTIEWATRREENVIHETLKRLAAADEISYDNIEIRTNIKIICSDEGEQHDVEAFIDRGGC